MQAGTIKQRLLGAASTTPPPSLQYYRTGDMHQDAVRNTREPHGSLLHLVAEIASSESSDEKGSDP